MISLHPFFIAVLLIVASPAMRAHDPFDITAQARQLPAGIELRLTLASSTAHRLLSGVKTNADLRPGQFNELRADLERRAPRFLILSAGNEPLIPKSLTSELTPDGDIKLVLRYPPSSARRFRFDAALLRTLATDHYTVFLLLRGPRDDQAVHERLTLEKTSCELPAFPP